jgi:hypothetical protein
MGGHLSVYQSDPNLREPQPNKLGLHNHSETNEDVAVNNRMEFSRTTGRFSAVHRGQMEERDRKRVMTRM